jgi:hypothetical protein
VEKIHPSFLMAISLQLVASRMAALEKIPVLGRNHSFVAAAALAAVAACPAQKVKEALSLQITRRWAPDVQHPRARLTRMTTTQNVSRTFQQLTRILCNRALDVIT